MADILSLVSERVLNEPFIVGLFSGVDDVIVGERLEDSERRGFPRAFPAVL